MAILVFVLSLILLAAGAASGYASLDLLPTSVGVLYALAGAVAVSAAVVTFALAVAIRRIDALVRLIREPDWPATADLAPASQTEPAAEVFPASAPAEPEQAPALEDESPININRAGHLPSLETVDPAFETPEAPPTLIGRYSSGGASYKIFADGSIEAELSEGTFKFASMGEFKRYLVESKGERQADA